MENNYDCIKEIAKKVIGPIHLWDFYGAPKVRRLAWKGCYSDQQLQDLKKALGHFNNVTVHKTLRYLRIYVYP